MSDNRKIQLEAEVRDNTRAGFDSVKANAASMAQGVEQSAQKASKSVDGIGDGANAGAQKFDAGTRSIIGSIERATAALKAGEKGTASYYEALANQRGGNMDALRPYLEQLRQAERAQQVATGSLNQMGISAAQTTAALRQVPMQFTDIIVSLQAGQQPLTVLLQQGGQLKDMFGGAGAAARAMAGYVAGLVNPFTLLAVAVAGGAVAYNQGAKEADAYRAAIITTGNAAGTTVGQLTEQARAIAAVVGTQGKAAETLAALAGSGKVGSAVLKEAAQASIAWERATGTAVEKTAAQFAALAADPLNAVLKLNDGTNFLTESVYRQIKSLDEQGKTAEAAAVAQRAWADALTTRGGAIERSLGSIESAWLGITDAAKKAWDAMLNIGRPTTNEDELSRVRKLIENKQLNLDSYKDTRAGQIVQAEIAALRAQEAALNGVVEGKRLSAKADAERAAQLESTVKWDKDGAKYLSDRIKLERDLNAAREQGIAAGKSQEEIERRLGQIRASYAKSGSTGKRGSEANPFAAEQEAAKVWAKTMESAAQGIADVEAKTLGLNKAQAALLEYLSSPAYATNSEDMRQAALAKLYAWDASLKNAEAIKAEAVAMETASKAMSAWYEARTKESASLSEQVKARREDVAAMGLSAEATAALSAAKYEQAAAEKEAYAAALEAARFYAGEYADAYEQAAEQTREQAQQLRDLAGLEIEKGAKKAALNVETEWKRSAESINNSLTDALLRGFESGKDFVKNFRDTLVNMFKTTILRPIIQYVMAPVSNGIMSFFGGGGGGGGGVGDIVGMGSSLFGGNSMFGLGGVGMAASNAALGTSLGLGASSSAAGAAAAAAAGGTSAAAAGGAAAAGSGIASAAAAIPVWGWVVAAIALLASFASKPATPHMGGLAQYSEEDGLKTSNEHGAFGMGFGGVESNEQTLKLVGGIAKTMTEGLDKTAQVFGREAGYTVATAFADDSSKDGAWGGLRISRGGKDIINWDEDRQSNWAPREFANGEEGARQYAEELGKSMRDALYDMDLPGWAEDVLKELGDSPTIDKVGESVARINAGQEAINALGDRIASFGALSGDAVSALVEAAGGVENLTASMASYYDHYYTAAEKAAAMTRDITSTLAEVGLEMPKSREEFKRMMDAALAMGEAGAETVMALLSVEDEFYALTDSARAAQEAMGFTGDSLKGIFDTVLEEAGSAEEARQMANEMFQEQIYDGMTNAMTSGLSDMIMSGVVGPMIESLVGGATASSTALAAGGATAAGAMAAGGAAGGAASAAGGGAAAGSMAAGGSAAAGAMVAGGAAVGATVVSVIDQARAFIGAFIQIMGDPAVQDMIGQIGGMVGEVGGIAWDAQAGWGGGGGGGGGGGSPGSSGGPADAADDLADALRRLGDAISDEVTRLRGLMVDDSEQSQEVLLARFATATAQARAGDQKALDLLPELSRSIEAATKLTAVSSVELARMRGWLAGSLTDTLKALNLDVPAFAVGTNYVPRDMLAMVHEGEAIVPKAFNPSAFAGGEGGGDDMLAEIRGLRVAVQALAEQSQDETLAKQGMAVRAVRVLERWETGGMPQPRKEGVSQ